MLTIEKKINKYLNGKCLEFVIKTEEEAREIEKNLLEFGYKWISGNDKLTNQNLKCILKNGLRTCPSGKMAIGIYGRYEYQRQINNVVCCTLAELKNIIALDKIENFPGTDAVRLEFNRASEELKDKIKKSQEETRNLKMQLKELPGKIFKSNK